jgi:hypothetical protein
VVRQLHSLEYALTVCGAAQDAIAKCWDGSPVQRPTARALVSKLQSLKSEVDQMDKANPRGVVPNDATRAVGFQRCACVIC